VRWFLATERQALGGANGPVVIAVSRALAARMRSIYPAVGGRLVVVHNGADTARFHRLPWTAAGVERRRELGLEGAYVGLLLAHEPVLKGVEAAIRALAEAAVRDLSPAFHLLVAKNTMPRRLRALAARLGVAGRLAVVGRVDEVRPWLAAADVLVHPTWYDPCSLACLEALAMEVPVITTPWNGVRELMGRHGGIVLEEAGNPEALAVAIRVLADPALRAMTAEDARAVALRHPMAARLDEVLDVCHGVGPGAAA
jgi:UDP-glucose:(heptosyl)LPS alpha-1,3-glucosyltransferase